MKQDLEKDDINTKIVIDQCWSGYLNQLCYILFWLHSYVSPTLSL